MKLSIWDTLSIGVLAVAAIIFIMVLAIFFNPGAPVNPYPPAGYRTQIPPTPTATLNQLPATWTPSPTIASDEASNEHAVSHIDACKNKVIYQSFAADATLQRSVESLNKILISFEGLAPDERTNLCGNF